MTRAEARGYQVPESPVGAVFEPAGLARNTLILLNAFSGIWFSLHAGTVWACATCSLQTPRLVERYGLAFAVLLAAPFAIAAIVGGLILRSHKSR